MLQLDFSAGHCCYLPMTMTSSTSQLSTYAYANADCLSRLPLQSTSDQQLNEKASIRMFDVPQISALPITCKDIQDQPAQSDY